MRPTIFLSLLGLVIGITWLTLGFLQMLFIVFMTLLGSLIGYWLETKQFSFKERLRQFVIKLTQ